MSLESTLKVQKETLLVICGLLGHFASLSDCIWPTPLGYFFFFSYLGTNQKRRKGEGADWHKPQFILSSIFHPIIFLVRESWRCDGFIHRSWRGSIFPRKVKVCTKRPGFRIISAFQILENSYSTPCIFAWPWLNYLTSLSLNSFIYKIGVDIPNT